METAREWLDEAARGAGSRPLRAYDAPLAVLYAVEPAQYEGHSSRQTLARKIVAEITAREWLCSRCGRRNPDEVSRCRCGCWS